ncbi:MAG: glycoside hydrolase family 88 protein [Ignavibacteriales bacterium]|nr:glycoside hydrolase family 88 protein [Ignavibacteriales bacterium]
MKCFQKIIQVGRRANIFKKQAEGIARWQSENGLWHQLIDKNDSYLETSASAMFVFGLARGVNRGWIDQDFSYVADIGWDGVLENIDEEGNVKNICVGTGIMPALSFYINVRLNQIFQWVKDQF